MILSLETNPLLRVSSCCTAKDMWEKLVQIFDVKSTENIDILRNKFHNITWEPALGMNGHLAKFDDIQNQFTIFGKPINEDDLCARLLQTLPKEYDHIYVTGHDTPKKMKMWDTLQKKCLVLTLQVIAARTEPLGTPSELIAARSEPFREKLHKIITSIGIQLYFILNVLERVPLLDTLFCILSSTYK
uniref:Uncharacterized protein n=1 Tax=Cuerna arida TaxID=1464854 RepID=A0A1B6FU56_9HEMI